eukprot:jgi/Picre1/35671/NNA_003132.t1
MRRAPSKCQALGTAQSHFGSQWLKKTLSDFETNSVDISLPDVSDLRMRDVESDGALQGVDDLTKRMNADVSIDASAFSPSCTHYSLRKLWIHIGGQRFQCQVSFTVARVCQQVWSSSRQSLFGNSSQSHEQLEINMEAGTYDTMRTLLTYIPVKGLKHVSRAIQEETSLTQQIVETLEKFTRHGKDDTKADDETTR